jgi:hypothetical protein
MEKTHQGYRDLHGIPLSLDEDVKSDSLWFYEDERPLQRAVGATRRAILVVAGAGDVPRRRGAIIAIGHTRWDSRCVSFSPLFSFSRLDQVSVLVHGESGSQAMA